MHSAKSASHVHALHTRGIIKPTGALGCRTLTLAVVFYTVGHRSQNPLFGGMQSHEIEEMAMLSHCAWLQGAPPPIARAWRRIQGKTELMHAEGRGTCACRVYLCGRTTSFLPIRPVFVNQNTWLSTHQKQKKNPRTYKRVRSNSTKRHFAWEDPLFDQLSPRDTRAPVVHILYIQEGGLHADIWLLGSSQAQKGV